MKIFFLILFLCGVGFSAQNTNAQSNVGNHISDAPSKHTTVTLGRSVNGGGNDISFTVARNQVVEFLKKYSKTELEVLFHLKEHRVTVEKFMEVLDLMDPPYPRHPLEPTWSKSHLRVVPGGEDRACINQKHQFIKCDPVEWKKIDEREVFALVLHEYLGVLGLEENIGSASTYPFSSRLLEHTQMVLPHYELTKEVDHQREKALKANYWFSQETTKGVFKCVADLSFNIMRQAGFDIQITYSGRAEVLPDLDQIKNVNTHGMPVPLPDDAPLDFLMLDRLTTVRGFEVSGKYKQLTDTGDIYTYHFSGHMSVIYKNEYKKGKYWLSDDEYVSTTCSLAQSKDALSFHLDDITDQNGKEIQFLKIDWNTAENVSILPH